MVHAKKGLSYLQSTKLRKRIEVFDILKYVIVVLMAILCLLPFCNIIAISLSSSKAASAGQVGIWPVGLTLDAYVYVIKRTEFWHAMLISIVRVAIGVPLNMILTILLAYPLSKNNTKFKMRTVYVWFFFFTTLFSGGLIPSYILVKQLGLIDTIFALIIPGAVPIFNVILLLNFFRNLPKELEEAAIIDGAGHWKIMCRIYIPVSLPAITTLVLFVLVGHWNSWFDGIIYMNRPENYPLQSYLRTVITMVDLSNVNGYNINELKNLAERTIKASQIVIATLPIVIAYPFMQKYFTQGMVLGSVKG